MEYISLESAIKILLENTNVIKDLEEKNIMDSLGYVLAEDIYSTLDSPPFNRSPLDGFTFNAKDSIGATKETPKEFKVIDEVYAGGFTNKRVGEMESIRIMTGAPIPEGCNCVIMQEQVVYSDEKKTLQIFRELKDYENFCFKGEDLKLGELVVKKDELITYNHIGVFASLGINKVKVYKKPVVGVLSLGTELIMPGEPLETGKIYNSNLFTLVSKLKYLGVEAKYFPPMSDNTVEVANFIEEKLNDVDILITTGGVSVGKMDIMHDVIKELDAKRLFWKIQIQPGTPILASTKNDKIILSLSGNPFASLVNFELLGREILAKMSLGAIRPTVKRSAIVNGSFDKSSSKRRFIRGFFKDGEVFLNNNKHASGTISSFVGKNAVVEIMPGTEKLENEDEVKVILID